MKDGYLVLIIDDEQSILNTLARLFKRIEDMELFTTTDPYEAESILKKHEIDLVIADERMPKVKGHAFLAFVKEHYPFTVRMILTGFADPEVLEAAINRGEVYRFLQKPWDDEQLINTVRRALEHGALQRSHHQLQEELKQKNRDLERLNSRLESMVQRRTAELQKTLELLKKSRDRAVEGFEGSTSLLSSIINLFQREIGNHARRCALLCEDLAPRIGLKGEAKKQLIMAAWFHEIGRLSGPGGGAGEGESSGSGGQYAEIGENIISQGMGIKGLGRIIRHHREHYDGTGKPDGLSGQSIPVEARALKVVAEYDWMLHRDGKSTGDALAFLLQHSGQLYDPEIVRALHALLKEKGKTSSRELTLTELQPGMELLSDIFLKDGVLFLPGKSIITEETIDRLKNFADLIDQKSRFYVKPESAEDK